MVLSSEVIAADAIAHGTTLGVIVCGTVGRLEGSGLVGHQRGLGRHDIVDLVVRQFAGWNPTAAGTLDAEPVRSGDFDGDGVGHFASLFSVDGCIIHLPAMVARILDRFGRSYLGLQEPLSIQQDTIERHMGSPFFGVEFQRVVLFPEATTGKVGGRRSSDFQRKEKLRIPWPLGSASGSPVLSQHVRMRGVFVHDVVWFCRLVYYTPTVVGLAIVDRTSGVFSRIGITVPP